jgi:two-component system, NarL family, nitrate/nitrite response regulator NarL
VSCCEADRVPTRCLIVDDNPVFLEAAGALLEREGLAVAGLASTGEEGLEQARTSRPDVVLVDIALGLESGVELARRLVEDLCGAVPVILISTRAEEDAVQLLEICPAAAFLPKSKLSADAIRRIIEDRGSHAASARPET